MEERAHKRNKDLLLLFPEALKMKTLPKVHTYPIASLLNIPEHHGRNQVDALNIVRLLVENVNYDTSFLKRMQVVMNGDVESNPGPISIEAHCATIAGFHGKARPKNKFQN